MDSAAHEAQLGACATISLPLFAACAYDGSWPCSLSTGDKQIHAALHTEAGPRWHFWRSFECGLTEGKGRACRGQRLGSGTAQNSSRVCPGPGSLELQSRNCQFKQLLGPSWIPRSSPHRAKAHPVKRELARKLRQGAGAERAEELLQDVIKSLGAQERSHTPD